MRGVQLQSLITQLRAEVARSTNVAIGVGDLNELTQKIVRQQELLYDEFDWPFLREVFPAIQMNASQQYYDFPTDLNAERISDDPEIPGVIVWYSGLPRGLDRGIGFRQYAIYNSTIGVTQEPVLRWDIRWTGAKEQMEVWPIPNSQSQTIQMVGIRKLRPMVKLTDVCDLDDKLIVLFVAAEMMVKQNMQSAESLQKLAIARFARLKARWQTNTVTRRMGMGKQDWDKRFPIIVHARAATP